MTYQTGDSPDLEQSLIGETEETTRDIVAKWLAAVIENGEPYADYATMPWSDFAGGEEMADGYRELADQVISIIQTKVAQ